MTRIELHEHARGRVLPSPAEDTTTISQWVAHQALDADRRTKHPVYREVAARLIVVEVEA